MALWKSVSSPPVSPETLYWSNLTGTLTCSKISLTESVSSGPTPSPGMRVTWKVRHEHQGKERASAREASPLVDGTLESREVSLRAIHESGTYSVDASVLGRTLEREREREQTDTHTTSLESVSRRATLFRPDAGRCRPGCHGCPSEAKQSVGEQKRGHTREEIVGRAAYDRAAGWQDRRTSHH